MFLYTMCSICMCVDMLQENVLVKNLNISLAFFVNTCLSLMDRSFIFQLIKIYCKAVSSSLSLLLLDVFVYYIVSQQNNTDVGHYNFSAHQPILVIFGEMLLRQYAIK